MPRILETTVYKFHELGEIAKEKARDNWRINGLDDQWYDSVIDDAKYCGALLGIDIDRIFFTGFCSQGDGACFEGTYEYRKGWRKEVYAAIGGDDLNELLRIGDALQDIQQRRFYSISASCHHSGHYMHSGCMDVNVYLEEHPSGGYWNDITDDQQAITDELRLFADWIYSSLKKEHDYLTSDEAVDEAITANELEFDEHGNMV